MELVIRKAAMREKFPYSVYQVQLDGTLGYTCIINTDASAKAIGTVLKQEDKDGRINVVSTAAHILRGKGKK